MLGTSRRSLSRLLISLDISIWRTIWFSLPIPSWSDQSQVQRPGAHAHPSGPRLPQRDPVATRSPWVVPHGPKDSQSYSEVAMGNLELTRTSSLNWSKLVSRTPERTQWPQGVPQRPQSRSKRKPQRLPKWTTLTQRASKRRPKWPQKWPTVTQMGPQSRRVEFGKNVTTHISFFSKSCSGWAGAQAGAHRPSPSTAPVHKNERSKSVTDGGGEEETIYIGAVWRRRTSSSWNV